MKLFTIGLGIAACSLLAGCASGPDAKPVDYKQLPGSGDQMAQGPGLFKVGDTSDYDDGVRVYSNEPSKNALIKSGNGAQAQTASTPGTTATAPMAQPTSAQQQDYREFQEYEQYKRFRQMPKDSAEYQRFKDWQEWKQYQQWRNSGNANP
ncbi:hypothetical protein [Salinisphaera aquimarina]|uniref:Lipoprotein n=1 Tax=Salinisphaera aquimarina TaxID=2094031 RepID=A0ABV7ETK9_9GAMM